MGTQAGVGISTHRNPRIAGREAAQRALSQAQCDRPALVLLFSTIGYDQRVLVDSVRSVTGDAPLCGCSGEGVIGRDFADESSYSVGVLILASDELRVVCGVQSGLATDPAQTGREMGAAIATHVQSDTCALLVFPDGLRCNFDRWISGLYEAAPTLRSLPLLGGLAGENFKMGQTFQFCGPNVITDGVVWMLLSGALRVAVAVSHGSIPIGEQRQVTACSGNVIEQIDGQSALSVLKEYIDETLMQDWGRAMVPLALGFPAPSHLADDSPLILRFSPGRDERTGSITLQTEVSVGQRFWMTRRDPYLIEAGGHGASRKLSSSLGAQTPKFMLHFDCGGRGKLLMREADKLRILKKLQGCFPPSTPWLGFYTYGEIGPVNRVNSFHNYTVVLAAFY